MHRRLILLLTVASAFAVACGVITTSPVQPQAPGARPLTFSILEDYDKGDDLSDVAKDFELFKELDVTTWRGSFGWDDYEPEPGQYDFAWLHEFISLAEREGITLRPYLGYTPAWAAGGEDSDAQAWNQPPREPSRWRAFVEAVGRELGHHRNVPSVEIYNEQNVKMWWEGSRKDYAATLATAIDALRRLGPFEILAGGLVYPDLEWVEDVCETARDFDVLPVHAYPETWTPEKVTVENYLGADFGPGFSRGVDSACGPKRIWINETGFATTPGKSETAQATWWVRAIATFAATPRVEHIGIYEIKDLRPDKPVIGDAPNYHLGLTRIDRTRKRAFATVDMLTDLFGAGEITVVTPDASLAGRSGRGELHHHFFTRKDGDRILVIWNRTADDDVRIRVNGGYARVSEYGLDGAVAPFDSPEPLRITLREGIPRILRFAAR